MNALTKLENATKMLAEVRDAGDAKKLMAGEHVMPDDWECVAWKAHGGYGSQGNGTGRDNSGRERLWFSPNCIKEGPLFR